MSASVSGPAREQEGIALPAPTPAHLAYLDGLRAVAALFVVVHHIMQLAETAHPLQGLWHVIFRPFLYGHFAVSVFIVLSGFCLMLPVVRGGWHINGGAKTFLAKRARRILPPYYAAMVVALVASALPSLTDEILWRPLTPMGFVSHLFLVHNLSPVTFAQINPVFWSVAVEFQIYLLFPILVLLWRRIGGLATTLGALIVGYVGLFILRDSPLDGITPHYIGLFALGMTAAAIALSPEPPWARLREAVPWSLAALAVAALSIALSLRGKVLPLRTLDLPIGVCAAGVLVAASRPNSRLLRAALSWKPLAFVGGFAYSLYLVHLPILWILARSSFAPATTMASNDRLVRLLVVGLPLAVLGSYGFYLVCERPFLRFRAAAVRSTS